MTLIDDAKFRVVRQQLHSVGRLSFTVVTDSMSPLIKPGDLIEVVPVEGDLRRFDIIVFKGGERLICHYVWHFNELAVMGAAAERRLITRGLNMRGEDLPLEPGQVLGKVVSHRIGGPTRLKLVLRAFARRFRRGVLS